MNPNKKSTRIPVLMGSVNPLAKAMEKKPKPPKSKSSQSQPETWYDEEIESVSQRQQAQSKTDHEKRKDALYEQLKKTEEELLSMQDLLDEREKIIKEAEEENQSPSQKENESNGASEGGNTGNDESGEQSEKVEKITKKTMKSMRNRMHEMREKLHKMNRETDSYLADIENTMQYLDSLETASDRLGPLSAETRRLFGDADDENIIARIYKENNEPKNVEATERGDGDRDRESSEEEEEEEEESPRDKSKKSKFFLTERTATSNPVQDSASVEFDGDRDGGDDDGDDANDQ